MSQTLTWAGHAARMLLDSLSLFEINVHIFTHIHEFQLWDYVGGKLSFAPRHAKPWNKNTNLSSDTHIFLLVVMQTFFVLFCVNLIFYYWYVFKWKIGKLLLLSLTSLEKKLGLGALLNLLNINAEYV